MKGTFGIGTVLLLLYSFVSHAQNLVPNSSFEDTVNCPNGLNQIYKAKYWINPTNGSPDYFNACTSLSAIDVPNNGWGNQNAYSGAAYGGFYAYNPVVREYVQIQLADTLALGHKYLVSIFVNLSEISQYAVSSIGVVFSSTQITSSTTGILPYVPQVQNQAGNIISDKINWVLIQDTLLSDGTEQFITIGNFNSDSSSDTTYLGNFGGADLAYYFVDDVSVIDVLDLGVSEVVRPVFLNIFPNPASDELFVEAKVKNTDLRIYDVLGNKVMAIKFSDEATFNIQNLSPGVYFLRVSTDKGIVSRHFIKE